MSEPHKKVTPSILRQVLSSDNVTEKFRKWTLKAFTHGPGNVSYWLFWILEINFDTHRSENEEQAPINSELSLIFQERYLVVSNLVCSLCLKIFKPFETAYVRLNFFVANAIKNKIEILLSKNSKTFELKK